MRQVNWGQVEQQKHSVRCEKQEAQGKQQSAKDDQVVRPSWFEKRWFLIRRAHFLLKYRPCHPSCIVNIPILLYTYCLGNRLQSYAIVDFHLKSE